MDRGERHEERWRRRQERLQERRERWARGGQFRGRGTFGPSRAWFAVVIIAVGALSLLGNLGILHDTEIWDYWPVILIVQGVLILANSRGSILSVPGIILTVIGSAFLLRNLGYLPVNYWNYLWPVLLILVGVALLFRRTCRPFRAGEHWPGFTETKGTSTSDNYIEEHILFGGAKRRVESQDFQGGEIHALFGGAEIDLRPVATTKPEVTLEIHAVFGGVEVIVPESWKVSSQGAGVFGAFENQTHQKPDADAKATHLVVGGGAVFGGVTVRN